jgi:preprotein translocase subunit YajC
MFDTMVRLVVFAQSGMGEGGGGGGGEEAPAAGPGCGDLGTMLPFFVIIGIFYFLLIRPQSKRQKKHNELVQTLNKGDRVITNSGIYGRVISVDDHTLNVEIAKNTEIKILKNQVACHQQDGDGKKETELLGKTTS